MTDALDFEAVVSRRQGAATATVIALPFDVRVLFGRARCPVRVTVNGHTWRTTTHVHGDRFHLVVNDTARRTAGVEEGDRVRVTVRRDDATRTLDVPAELAARLRTDPEAKDAFEALPPTHQRESARWVARAKPPETRVRRSAAATERLKSASRRSTA